jgi:ubiquinone/menaquinone biosynthesis C-methylase UbiE
MTTDWTKSEVAEGYEDYDPIRERALAYPVMFEQLGLADPAVGTVLDYGCGTGRVALRMVDEHGVSVVAADPSPAMLKVAKERRTHPKISYQLIGDDQRVDLSGDSVDAAISCFIFVCIPAADRIRKILAEVHRTLRPGAQYAMLELNPDMVGVPFEIGLMGEAGRSYAPGEEIEVRLATPGSEPLTIRDYHWPKAVHQGFLRSAGFRNIRWYEPTLPAGYTEPDADRMRVERERPPYTIYVAEK